MDDPARSRVQLPSVRHGQSHDRYGEANHHQEDADRRYDKRWPLYRGITEDVIP